METRGKTDQPKGYSRFQVTIVALLTSVATFLLSHFAFGWYAQYAKEIVIAAVGITLFVTLVSLGIVIGWNRLIRMVGLRESHHLSDLVESLIRVLVGTSDPEKSMAAVVLSKKLLAYYAWLRTSKAIIGLVFALLLALAGFFGSALIVQQNDLLESQNLLLGRQENTLSDQTQLMKAQTEAVNLQIRLLEDQNALSEATRLASFNSELSVILSHLHKEVSLLAAEEAPMTDQDLGKYEVRTSARWFEEDAYFDSWTDRTLGAQEVPNMKRAYLSSMLTGRIVAFANAIKPYSVTLASGKKAKVSRERAQLYQTLYLSEISLRPFEGALDLSHSDFRNMHLVEIPFYGMQLEYSIFDNANLNLTSFSGCDLSSVSFVGAEVAQVTFRFALLPGVENFKGCKIDPRSLDLAITDDPKWLEKAMQLGIISSTTTNTVDGKSGTLVLGELVGAAASGTTDTSRIRGIWSSPAPGYDYQFEFRD